MLLSSGFGFRAKFCNGLFGPLTSVWGVGDPRVRSGGCSGHARDKNPSRPVVAVVSLFAASGTQQRRRTRIWATHRERWTQASGPVFSGRDRVFRRRLLSGSGQQGNMSLEMFSRGGGGRVGYGEKHLGP